MPYNYILLIDDDDDDQEIFLAAMEMVPTTAQCEVISNAQLALEKLLRKELEPDLIMLDLNMPIMTGQQFLAAVQKHEQLSHIPIIVLSTSAHSGTIEETKKLGAVDFITKPSRFDELITILEEVVTRV